MRVLYLGAHRPHRVGGNRGRMLQQVEILSSTHDVRVLCFTEVDGDSDDAAFSSTGAELRGVRRNWIESILGVARATLRGFPVQVGLGRSDRMRRTIQEQVVSYQPDLVFVHMLRMAQYFMEPDEVVVDSPVLVDFQDCVSERFRDIARREDSWIRRKLLRWEARRLERFESRMLRRFRTGIVTTDADARALGARGQLRVIPMGVSVAREPHPEASTRAPSIGLVGRFNSDYNCEAAHYFHREIFPHIRKRLPDAELHLIGADPRPDIQELSSENVIVTGFVEDIEGYLAKMWIAVAPQLYGSGILNKILEPMSLGVPVVSTEVGLKGLGAEPGREILAAGPPEQFADTCLELLEDENLRSRIGEAGRRFIQDNYSLERVRELLLETVHEVAAENGQEGRRPSQPGAQGQL